MNLTNSTTCEVFGHNLVRNETSNGTEILCSSCKSIMQADTNGNYKATPSTNKEIFRHIQQLVLLNLRKKRLRYSY